MTGTIVPPISMDNAALLCTLMKRFSQTDFRLAMNVFRVFLHSKGLGDSVSSTLDTCIAQLSASMDNPKPGSDGIKAMILRQFAAVVAQNIGDLGEYYKFIMSRGERFEQPYFHDGLVVVVIHLIHSAKDLRTEWSASKHDIALLSRLADSGAHPSATGISNGELVTLVSLTSDIVTWALDPEPTQYLFDEAEAKTECNFYNALNIRPFNNLHRLACRRINHGPHSIPVVIGCFIWATGRLGTAVDIDGPVDASSFGKVVAANLAGQLGFLARSARVEISKTLAEASRHPELENWRMILDFAKGWLIRNKTIIDSLMVLSCGMEKHSAEAWIIMTGIQYFGGVEAIEVSL